MKRILFFILISLLLVSLIPQPVHADVAPPETVPGSNLLPGGESTQVRMVAEMVILSISKDPADENGAIAKTEATFTMRNLGNVEETMDVRFPLSFFNGNSDGFGNFPEIQTIKVNVNGKSVTPRRENQPFINNATSYQERTELPWAVFEVTFPPDQDILIEVVYEVEGFGYFPYEVFRYVLETGAGWNGTIGSAEVVLRLPYEVNEKNVWVQNVDGYGEPTQGGVMSGNEIRWNYEDLEPTFENNLQFILLAPSVWESVLAETENTTRNPKDGEAWGRLGKAYKEIIMMPKGYLRTDPGGVEMFALSRRAYETCLALLPNDPLWQYGYADLLWSHYYFDIYLMGKPDTENILPTTLTALQTALSIDPDQQQAKDLLLEISYAIPDAVQQNDNGIFSFSGLTATPVPPTPWAVEATPTFPPAEPAPTSTLTMGVIPQSTPEPTATNPLCGSAFLLPVLFGMMILNRKRK